MNNDFAEFQQLQQAIAYEAARSDIEIYCREGSYALADRDLWHNIDSVPVDVRDLVDTSVRYLELLGVLERRNGVGVWVRILELSQARPPLNPDCPSQPKAA